MSNSLKIKILTMIKDRYPESVKKTEIEDYARFIGFDAENGARRTRELAKEGYIERIKGLYASYRYKQPVPLSREEQELEILKQATL